MTSNAELAFMRATLRRGTRINKKGGGRPDGSKDLTRRKNAKYAWDWEDIKTKFLARVWSFSALSEVRCWLWHGATTRGFGYLVYGSRQDFHGKQPRIQAHRLSWLIYKGELDKKELVGQECGRKLCVNPDHLYIYRR